MVYRIAVTGACGRMGKEIVKAVLEQDDMELVLAVDVGNIGSDAGDIAMIGRTGVTITPSEALGSGLKESKAQVLVDFTNPSAVLKNVEAAAENGVDMVIGTTGLNRDAYEGIETLVKRNNVSAVVSPNMATGVNLFFKLVRDAASHLGGEYDVEIIEVHHHNKKDAPSGTALRAGELIADALGRDIEKDGVFGRKGIVGERRTEEIGFHAVRAGDVVGDHTVLFAGEGERIEITHRAHSRAAFVNGVIKAIRFLMIERSDGGRIYNTWDVLGIK